MSTDPQTIIEKQSAIIEKQSQEIATLQEILNRRRDQAAEVLRLREENANLRFLLERNGITL